MNKVLFSVSAVVIFFSLSLGTWADLNDRADMASSSSPKLVAQSLPEAYNDTFNQNQAALLKALPCSVVYYPGSDANFSLEEVQATAQGPYCAYKLTYFATQGGQLTIEGCNGGIGDIPLKSGFNAYTIPTPFGSGQAYLKSGSAKDKAEFYSQWLEVEPNIYCRFSAKNVPDRYIKGLAAGLKKLD